MTRMRTQVCDALMARAHPHTRKSPKSFQELFWHPGHFSQKSTLTCGNVMTPFGILVIVLERIRTLTCDCDERSPVMVGSRHPTRGEVMIDKMGEPLTQHQIELDAVRLWVQRIPPGRHSSHDLIRSYDEWSDANDAPEFEAPMRLTMRLMELGYQRWRNMSQRGVVIDNRYPRLLDGRAGRSVWLFMSRVSPQRRYTDAQLYDAYVPWARGMGEPVLTQGWFVELGTRLGLPRWDDGFITAGSAILPTVPDAGASA